MRWIWENSPQLCLRTSLKIFIWLGSEWKHSYVYVLKDYTNEGHNSDEKWTEGDRSHVIEDSAETTKNGGLGVSFLEVPDGCSGSNPKGLNSREEVHDPELKEIYQRSAKM